MIVRRADGSVGQVAAVAIRDAANVLRANALLSVRSAGNTLEPVAGGLSVAVAPSVVSGSVSASAPRPVTTDQAVVTPSGGVQPYTYQWARTDANEGAWDILSPSSPQTAFRALAVPSGEARLAVFTCTVTDASGQSATSPPVSAQADNFGYGDGPIP